jgi:PhnB protein
MHMIDAPKPEPVKGGLVAYLMVDGAIKAANFYEKAFGAVTAGMHPPDETGRTMHVHLYVNGSSLMLSDGYPEHGCPVEPSSGFNLTLMLERDIDAAYKRAIDAGCTEVMAPQDMFWGDRYAQMKDPWGVLWSMNQPVG